MSEDYYMYEEQKQHYDFRQFLDGSCLKAYDIFNQFQSINDKFKRIPGQQVLREIDYFISGYICGSRAYNQVEVVLEDLSFLNRVVSYGLIRQNHKLLLLCQSTKQKLNLKEIVEEFLLDQRDINLIKVQSQIINKKDEELIRQIKELEEFQLEKSRKNREQKDYQNFTCSICLEPLNDLQYTLNESCSHIFHTDCLIQHIKVSIDTRKFPIVCPLNFQCKCNVNTDIIEDIVDPDTLQKFQDYTLKYLTESHADEYSCCPTPNCSYLFAYSEEDNDKFGCPVCRMSYCLNCRAQYHVKQTCKEYQINNSFSIEDQQFMKFVAKSKFKQCKKCKFWVEKNEGCNHMTCKCGYEFCYHCGEKYPQCKCKR